MRTMEKVIITWVDACSNDAWFTAEEANDFPEVLIDTIGFVIAKDKYSHLLCQGYGGGKYHGLFRIPAGCIKKIVKMK